MNRIPRLITRAALPAGLAAALVLSGCTSGGTQEPEGSSAPETSAAAEESAPADSGNSSREEIVEGFPTDLLPEFPDSTMQSNTAEPNGELLSVNLTSSTDKSEKDVLDFYTKALEDQDFKKIGDAQKDDGTTSLGFQRGDGAETLALTISPNPQADGELLISIGGTVKNPEGEKSEEE